MIPWLSSLLQALTERRFQGLLLGVGAAAMVILFGAAALGFGTLAAYVYLRASHGVVEAALVICGAYALLAISIVVIAMVRRRARISVQSAASAPPAPASDNLHSLFQGIAEAAAPQDRETLLAALQLARSLTPFQLFAIALIGGFVAGRKLGK